MAGVDLAAVLSGVQLCGKQTALLLPIEALSEFEL
jgi:hypothetical protein